ncbi:MAG: hypothetical protein Fur0026_14770 [Sideroxydans sp.]
MRACVYYVLGLLGAVFLLYGAFLSSPPLFDDLYWFTANAGHEHPLDQVRYSPFELRSLPYASFAWGKALFGLDMWHFRIENALLHAAVAITLFFFLVRLLRQLSLPSRLSPEGLAFSAALLFVLHPVAVYAAGYLVQRTMLMATLFSLLAMLAWLRGCEQGNGRWLWVSVVFYYLAVFSKEHAIMLPAVLLAMTILLHEDWLKRLRQHVPVWAALGVIALTAMLARSHFIGTLYEVDAPKMQIAQDVTLPLSMLTQAGLFFRYLGLWVFPNPRWMSADLRVAFPEAFFSVHLLGLLAYLGWGVLSLWLLCKRGRRGMFGLAMFCPWILFWTEFTVIRIQEPFVLYRSYLWMAGFLLAWSLLLSWLDRRLAWVLAGCTALLLIPASLDRLATFSHPLMLWDDALQKLDGRDLPGAGRIYYNRGTEWLMVDEYDAAIKDLRHAIELDYEPLFAYHNLGAAYGKKRQWAESEAAFDHAIRLAQEQRGATYVNAYWGRATALAAQGKVAAALQDYRIACDHGHQASCQQMQRLAKVLPVPADK